MRTDDYTFFDGKSPVKALNNVIDAYDGSLLTNLKFRQLSDIGQLQKGKVLVVSSNSNSIFDYVDVNFNGFKTFEITNSNSSYVTWHSNSLVINHNMNSFVFVQLIDPQGGAVSVPTYYIDTNNIAITCFNYYSKPKEGQTYTLVCASGGISLDDIGKVNGIKLASCSNLGFYIDQTDLCFGWTDPDDVILNDSTLALWNRTVLVKKKGSYPNNYQDGQIIAETSRSQANKNYYRDHIFIDSSTSDSYYMLFSETTAGFWNNLDANKYSNGIGLSWTQVQAFVKAGRGAELFPVGTVFIADHSEYTTSNNISGVAFTVLGHDQVSAADETLTHTMCLGMSEVLFTAQFDAGQANYALTVDTQAISGKTYYIYNGSTYTALEQGTDWNAGDTVPTASWYEQNLNGRINGNNRFQQSNLLQWANSSNSAQKWFVKKNIWDNCGTVLLNKNGFLKNLDKSFLSVVKEAKLITAKSNVEGGGNTVIGEFKFWPLSMTQVFGNNNNSIVENTRLQYYVEGNSPIKYLNGTASVWWLRSPYVASAGSVYGVSASGTQTVSNASYSYGVSLACIIA